jgi:adenosylcobinamide-GDP ribazoletransferase
MARKAQHAVSPSVGATGQLSYNRCSDPQSAIVGCGRPHIVAPGHPVHTFHNVRSELQSLMSNTEPPYNPPPHNPPDAAPTSGSTDHGFGFGGAQGTTPNPDPHAGTASDAGATAGRPEEHMSQDPAPEDHAQDATTRILTGWWHDFRIAVGFLTILPLAPSANLDDHRAGLRFGARAFPLAGLVVGLFGALIYALANMLRLPPEAAAFIAIGAMIVFTGALHEDGLADMADGAMARKPLPERLAIMRDSRIGTFGTLTLIIVVCIKTGTITAIGWADQVAPMLIGCAAASRAVLPAMMRFMPPARSDGLAFTASRPEENQVVLSGLLGAALTLLFLGPFAGLVAIIAGTCAAGLVCWIARKRLGGVTGDVLGAAQQATETVMMLAVVAMS